MSGPDKVWLDWPQANRGEPVFDNPPENGFQAGQTCYVRRDPAVLAALPEVKALVAAERERCAKIAMDRWAAHRESADRTFELDYEGARESAVSRETRADEARAIAAAIREGRG